MAAYRSTVDAGEGFVVIPSTPYAWTRSTAPGTYKRGGATGNAVNSGSAAKVSSTNAFRADR